MITAASTALGRSEKSGARKSKVRMTITPVVSDAMGVLASAKSLRELADRLVETGVPCAGLRRRDHALAPDKRLPGRDADPVRWLLMTVRCLLVLSISLP